jgi:hypothetical protein
MTLAAFNLVFLIKYGNRYFEENKYASFGYEIYFDSS